MTNTTFNPSDKVGGTLSGGNLTFTATASSSVRTIDSLPSGKFYMEFTFSTLAGGQTVCGIANANAVLGSGGAFANAASSCNIQKSGNIFCNSSTVQATLGTFAAGTIIGLAIDCTSKLAWFRICPSGNWNGNAGYSPGGTGGINFTAISPDATLLPVYGYVGSNIGNDVVTANFGNSAFSGAVPSGFTGGFTTGLAPTMVAVATQTAVEEWVSPSPQAQTTQIAVEQWGLSGAVGTQATVTQVALEQWAAVTARVPIELAGNLGGVSSYGKLSYGVSHYSRVSAFEPVFSAALTVSIGQAFSGGLAPVVSFGAGLGIAAGVSGALVPIVTFAADLIVIGFVDFVADLAPQVALGASLGLDVTLTVLEGGLTPIVSLGASSFISGPLWVATDPCPPSAWTPTDPCPPPAWMASELCDSVTWTPTRLCNG